MSQPTDYSIGELARQTETKVETIRYFEKIGLLTAAARRPNGYRRYQHSHLRQLQFIQRCRKLGFSQPEVRDLVGVFGQAEVHTRAEVKSITGRHLQNVRDKIKTLQTLETSLSGLMHQCDGGQQPASGCPILASLSNEPADLSLKEAST